MKTTLLRVFAAIVLLVPALQQPASAQVDQERLMNVMRTLAVQADSRAQQETASRADAARQVLREMILQLQTGRPDPQWYGRDLWMTMAMQTGNTGVYPQLRLLGPVTDVQLTGQTQLPAGICTPWPPVTRTDSPTGLSGSTIFPGASSTRLLKSPTRGKRYPHQAHQDSSRHPRNNLHARTRTLNRCQRGANPRQPARNSPTSARWPMLTRRNSAFSEACSH